MAEQKRMTMVEQIFETILIEQVGKEFKKLGQIQMNTIPLIGHYYYHFIKKTLYNVEAIIHDDMNVYIVLSKTSEGDPYFGVSEKLYSNDDND